MKKIYFNPKEKNKKSRHTKNFIFLLNYSLLLINLYILYFNKNKKRHLILKNVDYFIFSVINQVFTNISIFLNSKYYYKQKFLFKKIQTKKVIYLDLRDLYKGQKIKIWLNNTLGNKFSFIFDSNKPDYLIFNVFGSRHLDSKYNNSVKIAYFTENRIPDLNKVDYALGFYHINYLDRYCKLQCFYSKSKSIINIIRKKYILKNKKKKFCAAVISNKNAFFRNNFLRELNKYKKVDMGGKYNNNIGQKVKNKIEFLSYYKFSIAMENSEGDGYTSEKIFQSFISGSIPIYFGNYMIDEYFNPKSFILIKSKKDIYNKIELIKKIDNDDKLYKSILNQNIFTNNKFTNKIYEEKYDEKNFFLNIFEQDKSQAFRRNE